LADFEPIALEKLFCIYNTLRRKSLVALTVPGVGKTPFSNAIMMSLSRDADDPAGPHYRMSSEIDFFRGEAGRVSRGDIFDDGDCSLQSTKTLKAFLDVALLEAAAWARWGGCRWAKGQPRILLDNKVWETPNGELTQSKGDRRPGCLSDQERNAVGLKNDVYKEAQ
jgi:hypothetical protein